MCVLCSVIRQHFVIIIGLCIVLIRWHFSKCMMVSECILYLCIQVKEERIGDVVRMRMNLRKGSWCLKRMDKVCCNTHTNNERSYCLRFKTWSAFSCTIFRKSFFYLLEYAQVIKMLGNGRLEAMCFDGVKRLCHIRGKLRKKVHFTDLVCEASDWMQIQHFHHFVNEIGCVDWQKCLGQSVNIVWRK